VEELSWEEGTVVLLQLPAQEAEEVWEDPREEAEVVCESAQVQELGCEDEGCVLGGPAAEHSEGPLGA
jgi:hypothetical protein